MKKSLLLVVVGRHFMNPEMRKYIEIRLRFSPQMVLHWLTVYLVDFSNSSWYIYAKYDFVWWPAYMWLLSTSGPLLHGNNITDYALSAGTTAMNAQRLLRATNLNKPILLEGSPGVGKTSLVGALARASGNTLVRINLSEQTVSFHHAVADGDKYREWYLYPL